MMTTVIFEIHASTVVRGWVLIAMVQKSLIVGVRVRPVLPFELARNEQSKDILRVMDNRMVVVLDPDESKVRCPFAGRDRTNGHVFVRCRGILTNWLTVAKKSATRSTAPFRQRYIG